MIVDIGMGRQTLDKSDKEYNFNNIYSDTWKNEKITWKELHKNREM